MELSIPGTRFLNTLPIRSWTLSYFDRLSAAGNLQKGMANLVSKRLMGLVIVYRLSIQLLLFLYSSLHCILLIVCIIGDGLRNRNG